MRKYYDINLKDRSIQAHELHGEEILKALREWKLVER